MDPNRYDAIVIGGGHNGLVAAAYLAKRGARTVVLEARHKVGGAADTMSPVAGRSRVQGHDAQLCDEPDARHDPARPGARPARLPGDPDGSVFRPVSGRALHHRARRPQANHAEFAKFSKRDADALEQWEAWIGGLADVLGPLLMTTPPRVGSRRPGDLIEQLRLAWRFRGLDVSGVADVTRLMTMSIVDILDRFFETDQVKTVMALNGLIGTWAGPHEPGTGYVMAHHSIGDVGNGQVGAWATPIGGMGAVAAALESSALALGAEIRTEAPVERILTREGRVRAVVLATGEELTAPTVVAATHPQITFLRQLEASELPEAFVEDIRTWKSRSGTVKINLALDRRPAFAAKPDQADLTGGFELAHSIAYLETAFEEARAGRAATRPFSDGTMPTDADPSLAPEGTHIVSLFTQWCPSEWADEPDDAELDAYADRVIAGYDELAPGFTDSILYRQVLGPHEMQEGWGLVGGNIFHGELSAEQLFHMRPAPGFADYRTPIAGLYQCSSATHAGGGVTGIPAYNCVREIVRDRKRATRHIRVTR